MFVGVIKPQTQGMAISKLQAALENNSGSGHGTRKKLITCPKCPARFYMNKDRTLHMRLHGANNEFTCQYVSS